jgi:hypothetical protein
MNAKTRLAMIRSLPLLFGLLGVLFLSVAVMYCFVPADSLPSFFPGFKAGYSHIKVKHAIFSLEIALALFIFSREARSEPPGVLCLLWSREVREFGFRPR